MLVRLSPFKIKNKIKIFYFVFIFYLFLFLFYLTFAKNQAVNKRDNFILKNFILFFRICFKKQTYSLKFMINGKFLGLLLPRQTFFEYLQKKMID